HFLDEYSHMPGPEVYMAYLAAQTENIHLGSAIFNITPKVNHPARVAETVALLDHITNRRFEFGTGRGSSTTEVFGLGMENREEAFEVAVSSGMNYYTSLQMHWLDNIPKPPNFPEWPELIPEPSVEELKKAVEIGMVVVGDPDDCANAIRKWEDIGADQL